MNQTPTPTGGQAEANTGIGEPDTSLASFTIKRLDAENAALREEPKQLEQWMREHGVRTMHQPHIEMAAEDYAPWQATSGFEYRFGVTEALACAALAKALNVEFPLTVTRPPLSFRESDKQKIEALEAELARLREENADYRCANIEARQEIIPDLQQGLTTLNEQVKRKDTELASLRATNAGLVADKERLDLLSKLAEHRVELFRNAAGRITLYVKEAPTDEDFVQAFAPTAREALDAAKGGER